MADGESFDRSVMLVFEVIRDTLGPIVCPFRWKLRQLFLNCGLYIKRPDKDKDFSEPVLIRRRETRNSLILHLKLPLGMAPQDFDKALDKLGFALNGTVSYRAINTPRVMELTVTKKPPYTL